VKKIAFAVAGMLAAQAWAGGPSNQVATFGSVVRVLSGVTDASALGTFQGTGTVIANRNIGGKGWLAVLTADHVVSTNQKATGATHAALGIAQGSTITGSSAGLAAPFVRRKGGDKVDLAVLGIPYGDYNPNIRFVRSLAETDPANLPASFTGLGYGIGLDADPTKNEWKSDGVAGQLRFYNNKKFTLSNGAVATQNGYENQVIEWKALAPGHADAMLGQGSTFLGDSGGPAFVNGPDKETIDGQEIPIMSNGIFAVHHTVFARAVNGTPVAVPYGGQIRSVYLNADYRQWINQQVQAVPEPSTLLAAGFGVAALLRRRPRAQNP
jgi:hypothetical protein